MIILFIHKGFPGQFKYLAPILAQDPKNVVLFLTEDNNVEAEGGINKIVFQPAQTYEGNMNSCLKNYESEISHARGAASMMYMMKQQNIIPDIIVAHNGRIGLFAKDIFPNVPLICYCEWMENDLAPAISFDGTKLSLDYKQEIRTNNSSIISAIACADGCISPTQWQKEQFPREFHHKIKVIHDGVDTNICKPDDNAVFKFKDKTFTRNDEVITYATRGMEPMRGFPEFMKAAEILLKKRPNSQILVGGNDRVCYGKPLKNGTYKELMLKKLDLDLSRIHFIGGLDFSDYMKLMQISSAHVYATFPFVLSWSLVEAMAFKCPIIASKTPPVEEVMQDNVEGLLYDFYDIDMLVEKIEFALDNKDKMEVIRNNARQKALENFALKDKLIELICYLTSFNKK